MTPQQTLESLWTRLQQHGYAALRDCLPATAEEAFYLAVVAFGHQDLERAAAHVRRAAQFEPDEPLFWAAQSYLERIAREGKMSVYTAPEAFAAFTRGGGNVPLYEAVSRALRQILSSSLQIRLLDIGVGDGRALLPALTDQVADLALVEPSPALLAQAAAALDEVGVVYRAYAETLQSFIGHAQDAWDVVQATFSLQSIPHAERPSLLAWLRRHAARLLVVEFDVPQFDSPYDPAHVRSVLRRFRCGLLEYEADRDLVAQGFLMPVLFGFFDPTSARTNYEQPLAAWVTQIREAGFGHVESRPLYGYWWAPAFMIDARSR